MGILRWLLINWLYSTQCDSCQHANYVSSSVSSSLPRPLYSPTTPVISYGLRGGMVYNLRDCPSRFLLDAGCSFSSRLRFPFLRLCSQVNVIARAGTLALESNWLVICRLLARYTAMWVVLLSMQILRTIHFMFKICVNHYLPHITTAQCIC